MKGRSAIAALALLLPVRPLPVVAARSRGYARLSPLAAERLAEGKDWATLENWAKGKGMSWNSWKVGEVNGIRGAVATRRIRAGEVIVRAPAEAVLLVGPGDECPLPPEFVEAKFWDEMQNYWNVRMALRILYEKRLGTASAWKPYIDVMPASFSTPLNWSDRELAELQFPPLVDELRVERSYFAHEADRLQKHMPDPVTQAEFFWALSCVGSRTFTADFGDQTPPCEAMCPIADMVNHNEASAPAFRWDDDSESFELFSPLALEEGEEVCISYGSVNNAHLLHYYGFVPAQNSFDSVPVTEKELQWAAGEMDASEGLSSSAKMQSMPLSLIQLRESVLGYLVNSNGGGLSLPLRHLQESWGAGQEPGSPGEFDAWSGNGHEFQIGVGGDMALDFVLYCRVWALTEADTIGAGTVPWTKDALSLAKLLQSGREVSREHGSRWRLLAVLALRSQLHDMPTSLSDDTELLAQVESGVVPDGWEGGTDKLAQALRFRIGHKQIIADAINSLEADVFKNR